MFKNREEAAQRLTELLESSFRNQPDTLVLAIPRGGVAVGAIVAQKLGLPWGVLVVRKLGYPGNPEFAVGAVDADGDYVLGTEFVQSSLSKTPEFKKILEQELKEVRRRTRLFNPRPLELADRNVILVDDGIATGQTNLVAIRYLQRHGAKKVVVAAPVASSDAVELLKSADAQVVVLETPVDFMAVGQFYEHFPQLTDQEVLGIIDDGFLTSSS
ncbi:MAG: phosphoribosyltransferase family protein [Patescibacteria group bacterium]